MKLDEVYDRLPKSAVYTAKTTAWPIVSPEDFDRLTQHEAMLGCQPVRPYLTLEAAQRD